MIKRSEINEIKKKHNREKSMKPKASSLKEDQ